MRDRRWIYPGDRVIATNTMPSGFELNENTEFKSIYSGNEVETLVKLFGGNKTNGTCIRMDSISTDGTVQLSKVDFFDFLTTNVLWQQTSWYSDSIEQRIKNTVGKHEEPQCVEDVLKIEELANVVAVSTLLEDPEGNVLLVRRGSGVAVGSDVICVSSTGSVDINDASYNNPFLACSRRELREELGIGADLTEEQLVVSRQKLQPVMLYTGKVNKPLNELVNIIKDAEDFSKENVSVYAVPKKLLPCVALKYTVTDVTAYQLSRAAGYSHSDVVTQLRWFANALKHFNLEDYELKED